MTRRRLAERLTRHTVDVMPPERRAWALGMAAELEHIDDDGAALAFALGAVWASYRQGARLWSNWLRLGRWGVGLSTLLFGALVLAFATGLHPALSGGRPPGPLGLLIAALAGCYLLVGWSFIGRRTKVFLFALLAGAALVITAAAIFPIVGVPVRAEAFYRALLLEEAFSLFALGAWAAIFRIADARLAGRRIG